ncbi:MAG: SIS domain-containing protein, partial [Fibrobacteres bacterium]|nr:SIS domain-containing protein [Fibrobacterota bacterium]
MLSNHEQKAESFLTIANDFQLGNLVTEQPHPLTTSLSELADNNLTEAYYKLKEVDLLALKIIPDNIKTITEMAQSIRRVIDKGGRIFLCGCGATGRLSLVCETLWRNEHIHDALADKVIGFMAGGDAALIRSIENFEDHPDYGERQLKDLGFHEGDLFIGCTEGGETPFVIGALEAAFTMSSRQHYFLYCNPDILLCRIASRSARVINNTKINKINLTCGPMAVTGSTRMQASTVLMAALGYALHNFRTPEKILSDITMLFQVMSQTNSSMISPLTESESDLYADKKRILYETSDDLAISILTDTTERSPTFSMIPFENRLSPSDPASLCYLYMPSEIDSISAWNKLLSRTPRALEWPEINGIASMDRLLGFDFSGSLSNRGHALFKIFRRENSLIFSLSGREITFFIPSLPP